MRKNYFFKATNIVLLLLFFTVLQIAQYTFVFHNIVLPTFWYLDFLLVLFFGSLVFLFPWRLFDKIYIPIIYGITVVFTLVNINFFNTAGDIFSLTYLAMMENSLNVAASAASIDIPFTVLGSLSILLLIAVILLFDRFLFKQDKEVFKEHYKKNKLVTSILAVVTVLICFTSYALTSANAMPAFLDNTILIEKKDNFKEYGMLNYYLKEAPYILFGDKMNNKVEKQLKEYFTIPQTTANSFTGLLKDYNVVNICVETGDDLMLNETLAPNLYSLFNDAITFNRNYSKNKTNISEFIGMTGSAPVAGIAKKYQYSLPFSVPTMLHEQGYSTLYFHDAPYETDVYDREELMPKLKFDEVYMRDDLFPGEPGWDFSGTFSLDSDAMPVVADKILAHKDDKFYAYYMTLSMHGPYDRPKNHEHLEEKYGGKYYAAVANGQFVNPLKGTVNEHCVDNYMMAVMDFDKGLGDFIQKFKDNGVYDKTLFVLYGDHEMYYVGADGIPLNKTLCQTEDMSYAKMYKTLMCFANPQLKKKFGDMIYDQFTTPYNVAPTILDLLGLKYNPNYYLGCSLFSPEMKKKQVFYSIELSAFFNEDFWSFSHKETFRRFNDKVDAKEFLQEVSRIVDREVKLNIIYTNDFFSTHDFKDYTF